MKNIFLVLILILSGCRIFQPETFCKDNYPPQIITHDSSWVVNHWDTTTIFQPYTELLFDTTTSIPNYVELHHSEKKGSLSARIDISHGHLTFKCSEDSLKQEIACLRETVFNLNSRVIREPCTLPHRSGWDYFCRWATCILLGIVLIVIALKIK